MLGNKKKEQKCCIETKKGTVAFPGAFVVQKKSGMKYNAVAEGRFMVQLVLWCEESTHSHSRLCPAHGYFHFGSTIVTLSTKFRHVKPK